MKCYTEDDVLSSFLAGLRCTHQYFDNLPTTLIIEICLCAPFSNASLERLFSKMNLIKTTLRNRWRNDNLNSILRINISGLSPQSFHDEHLEKCVNYRFNAKNRRLSQRKRKFYKKRESKKTKRPHFNISDIIRIRELYRFICIRRSNYKLNFIPLNLLM